VTTISDDASRDFGAHVCEHLGKSWTNSFEGEPHFTVQKVRPPRVRAQVEVAERLFPESHVRRRDYISGKVSPCTKHRAKSPRPDSLKSIYSSPCPCLHFSARFVQHNGTRHGYKNVPRMFSNCLIIYSRVYRWVFLADYSWINRYSKFIHV